MIEPSASIQREWIASRIPHQGSMCLLDHVDSWDEHGVVCLTASHLSVENPLRTDGVLGIANAIEYAAQAMAIHCALLIDSNKSAAPKSGYLTSVRQVNWHRSRFDDIAGDLRVCARRLSGNDITVLYEFEIHADDLLLIDGRASVVLNAGEMRSPSDSGQRN